MEAPQSSCNSPVTVRSHGWVSLLGNLRPQENTSLQMLHRTAEHAAFPVFHVFCWWSGEVPRAVHYQPKVRMKWIHSSSPGEPWGWSSCWGSLHSSALELPKSQPKQCHHCFSSYCFLPAYTHTEYQARPLCLKGTLKLLMLIEGK